MRLGCKTAFITGGTSGIGLATVEAFVEHGAVVGFTARKAEGVDSVVARLGERCVGFVADAADDAAMAEALAKTAEASGGIEIVFANAGHYVHIPWAIQPAKR